MTDSIENRWLLLLPDVPLDRSLPSVAEGIYFHMWRTRQEPWSALQDGDTVYVIDSVSRRIFWELRARHVRRTQYHSMDEAYTTVRESFGLFPEDLHDYVLSRPPEGFFLGWATEVVGSLDVPLPPRVDFWKLGARHGYLPWRKLPEGVPEALGLPPPGRPAIAEPSAWMLGESAFGPPARPLGRYIPTGVKRAVWARDGGRCRQCCTAEPPIHFDHIWPVVKGGGNELENIQLLCQKHNLEKAARIVEEAQRPAQADLVAALARELKFGEPRGRLPEFVRFAVAADKEAELAEALLQELAGASDPGELRPAFEMLREDTLEAALLRARLAEALAVTEPAAARSLAAVLLDHPDTDVRGTAALAFAHASPDLGPAESRPLYLAAAATTDPYVSGWGHYELAALEEDLDGPAARHHLEKAADSVGPSPRSVAAWLLGVLATDNREAEGWYRRALITDDPEFFARCAAELSAVVEHNACAYAQMALRAEAEDVLALAHLVLGLEACDDDPHGHLVLASKSSEEWIRDQALAELDSLSNS